MSLLDIGPTIPITTYMRNVAIPTVIKPTFIPVLNESIRATTIPNAIT
jgi:hypothetical protein